MFISAIIAVCILYICFYYYYFFCSALFSNVVVVVVSMTIPVSVHCFQENLAESQFRSGNRGQASFCSSSRIRLNQTVHKGGGGGSLVQGRGDWINLFLDKGTPKTPPTSNRVLQFQKTSVIIRNLKNNLNYLNLHFDLKRCIHPPRRD